MTDIAAPPTLYVVITPALRTALQSDPAAAWIDPRPIDTASPGIGLNQNPDASGFAGGAVVPLIGNYVQNARIVNDPDYIANAPGIVAAFSAAPWCLLDPQMIFLPPEED